VALHVADELFRVLLALGLVLGLDQPVEVVERELRVDGDERAVEADDRVDALTAFEAVLKLVLVTGEGIGEQVAQEKLAETAPRLRRTERLLEAREVLRAVEHLRVRLADLPELLVDGRGRARRALEPVVDAPVELPEAAVHRLDEAGQAPVDVGVALRKLDRELLPPRPRAAARAPSSARERAPRGRPGRGWR
jgi:hypothetical protein